MKTLSFSFVFMFIWLLSAPLFANDLLHFNGAYYIAIGEYYIEKDQNGVYVRTDKHGRWYLDEDDLSVFKVGESGSYYMEKDARRPYIITNKQRIIYVNQRVVERLKRETSESGLNDYGTTEVIKGSDKLWSNSRFGGIYATEEEARKGIKGQPTLEWERKRAEEEARRRAEEEARRRAELEAEEARREAEEARKDARDWGAISTGTAVGLSRGR